MDGTMLQSLLTLVAGVSIIGLMFYLLKKYTLKAQNSSGKMDLKVISKLPLQPKSSLFVVEAGDKKLLIGVSEKNINLISDLTEEADPEVNAIPAKKASTSKSISEKIKASDIQSPEALSFKNFLKSTMTKQKN